MRDPHYFILSAQKEMRNCPDAHLDLVVSDDELFEFRFGATELKTKGSVFFSKDEDWLWFWSSPARVKSVVAHLNEGGCIRLFGVPECCCGREECLQFDEAVDAVTVEKVMSM